MMDKVAERSHCVLTFCCLEVVYVPDLPCDRRYLSVNDGVGRKMQAEFQRESLQGS